MKARDLFTTIRTEGGLLPADLLQRLVQRDKDLRGWTTHLTISSPASDSTNRSARAGSVSSGPGTPFVLPPTLPLNVMLGRRLPASGGC